MVIANFKTIYLSSKVYCSGEKQTYTRRAFRLSRSFYYSTNIAEYLQNYFTLQAKSYIILYQIETRFWFHYRALFCGHILVLDIYFSFHRATVRQYNKKTFYKSSDFFFLIIIHINGLVPPETGKSIDSDMFFMLENRRRLEFYISVVLS